MNPKLWFGRCSKKEEPVDTKRQDLMREIKRARDDLSSAETAWAWAEPGYVDLAILAVDQTRARYQALVRELKTTYRK